MQKGMQFFFAMSLLIASGPGCGRWTASSLLRQGQLPVNNFPLYASVGPAAAGQGTIRKYSADGSSVVFASGLTDPRGIATDRYRNLYVVERANNRLLKFKPDGSYTVVKDGLLSPFIVALDRLDEPYVTQDGANNIIRVRDGQVLKSYSNPPTALVFGVNDLPIVGIQANNVLYWGIQDSSPSLTINQPANVVVDSSGRVYVTDVPNSGPNSDQIIRYGQQGPQNATLVGGGLSGPQGIAVDVAENVFMALTAESAIVVALQGHTEISYFDQSAGDVQYLAFTRY